MRENFFCRRIKLVSNFVDLILLPALLALQADFSAHP
jgi:3-deoxy-D-manno-octulosonic acid (KDO) 8-phosphate synthase